MSNSYPTLLNSKAKLLGNLTRYDLLTLGVSYLILSWMKVSGITSMMVNLLIFLFLKLSQKYLPRGFFRGIFSKRELRFNYKLGGLYE